MRKLTTACALASLTFAAGCGSDSSGSSATAPSSSATAPSSSATAPSSSATAPSSSEAPQTSSAAAPPSSAGAGATTVLTGIVGTADDPDAFVITLTDASGQPVTTLPAGEYSIEVQDLSEMHNFHLSGGSVDETTTVPEVVDTTFDVELEPGEYTFQCDPHAKMTDSFTVT